MEEVKTTTPEPRTESAKRPFLLTLLCLFSFVFFGLITLLFLIALLYTGTITDMVLRYAPDHSPARTTAVFYILGGFLLHAISLTGIILLWKMKKLGYMIFGISSLIIAAYQVFASHISPLTTGFYIGLIIAFGLFLRKLK
jgi:hypothetical protein